MSNSTGDQAYQTVCQALKGDQDAIAFFLQLCEVADTIDAIVDGDACSKAEVTQAFWTCLFALPENPFFKRHQAVLTPVMANAFLAWQDSNVLAKMGSDDNDEPVVYAHVLRYSIVDVGVFCAFLVGGQKWANEVGAALRMECRDDTLGEFIKEMKSVEVADGLGS